MIKIVTDTTCDLPASWFNRYRITVIPINIQFGLESFKEGVTINPEAFYQRIRKSGQLPTTSQPSIGEFVELYKTLAADGSEILSIHISHKLSGTWQTAATTARRLKDRLQLKVVDSLSGSTGLGFMVWQAAQLAETGLSLEEIAARLEARRGHISVFILLNDLRYARMSGRVGRVREMLASLLDIKPIITVDQGALAPVARMRSHRSGLAHMVALAKAEIGNAPVHVGVAHAMAPTEAENLMVQLQAALNCQHTFITPLAISVAVHFGPGTVGFAAYPAEDLRQTTS